MAQDDLNFPRGAPGLPTFKLLPTYSPASDEEQE